MTTYSDRIAGLGGNLGMKAPVRVATTANITLSGLQTIDGVALAVGDRVLVKDQDTGSENGIWAASSSDWTRALDFNGARDAVQGTQVLVVAGSVNVGNVYYVATASFTIGSSDLAFSQSAPNGTQPLDGDLTAIAALPSTADKVPYATGAGAWALADFVAFGRSLVAASNAAAARAAIGAQAANANLASLAGLTLAADKGLYATDAETLAMFNQTAFGRTWAALADAAAALAALGMAGRIVAHVNFTGSGTVTIKGAGNVSSITDNGAGDYWVNFTVAEPDTNYTVAGMAGNTGVNTLRAIVDPNKEVGRVRIVTRDHNNPFDADDVNLVVIR